MKIVNSISSDWSQVDFHASPNTPTPLFFYTKRIIDIILACMLLVMLSPLLLVIAILIKLDSRGTVFFVQDRVGAQWRVVDGEMVWQVRTFPFYKFRSMVQDADPRLHQARAAAYVGGDLRTATMTKVEDDPRITRIGHVIRRTSIDELPQLFNVVKGEMSLVGPRPIPVYEFAAYQQHHLERYAASPGITGLWQVKGRCALSFDDQIALDIEYVQHQNPLLDTLLLLQTIPAVIRGKGAG